MVNLAQTTDRSVQICCLRAADGLGVRFADYFALSISMTPLNQAICLCVQEFLKEGGIGAWRGQTEYVFEV